MSNIVLQPNASGTGNITIATPNTNTDRTLNIPDVAGNLVTTGDTGSVTSSMLSSGSTTSAIKSDNGLWHMERLEDYQHSGSTFTSLDIDLTGYTDFTKFKIYVHDIEASDNSYPALQRLISSGTTWASGWFGGSYYAGEGVVGSDTHSNADSYYFLGGTSIVSRPASSYKGSWEFDWVHHSNGRVSAWGNGMHRLGTGQMSRVMSGAQNISTPANYGGSGLGQFGIRFAVGSGSYSDLHYTLYGVRSV